MNVQEAWKLGATGKGISVTILDDGIGKSNFKFNKVEHAVQSIAAGKHCIVFLSNAEQC